MAMAVDGEDEVGDLPADPFSLADREVDRFPALDAGAVHLHGDYGVVPTASQEHGPDGVPLDPAPGLLVVLGKEGDDQLALVAVVTLQLEIAVQAEEFSFVPLVVEHAIAAQRLGQAVDHVSRKAAVFAGEGYGDGESFGL